MPRFNCATRSSKDSVYCNPTRRLIVALRDSSSTFSPFQPLFYHVVRPLNTFNTALGNTAIGSAMAPDERCSKQNREGVVPDNLTACRTHLSARADDYPLLETAACSIAYVHSRRRQTRDCENVSRSLGTPDDSGIAIKAVASKGVKHVSVGYVID